MTKTNSKIKRFLGMGILLMMLMATSIAVYADTTEFTLTVNNTGYQQDNLSKKTLKAGGANYENKCYVRATGFVGTGTVYVQSIKLDNANIHSASEIALGSGSSVNVLKNVEYNKYAMSGAYYYLKGRFGASTGSVLNVVGKYTP